MKICIAPRVVRFASTRVCHIVDLGVEYALQADCCNVHTVLPDEFWIEAIGLVGHALRVVFFTTCRKSYNHIACTCHCKFVFIKITTRFDMTTHGISRGGNVLNTTVVRFCLPDQVALNPVLAKSICTS